MDRPRSDSSVEPRLVFCCQADNDLYLALTHAGVTSDRFDNPAEALAAAQPGAGLLVLADGYPDRPTDLTASFYDDAVRRDVRVFVEYPASLPGLEVGSPYATRYERAVVADHTFAPDLDPLRILAVHDCHLLPVEVPSPSIVAARVAGFDTAVHGLPEKTYPLLFEHPDQPLLVASTQLSRFITARYGPREAWPAIWRYVFRWLQPQATLPKLDILPTVRPTYGPDQPLGDFAVNEAIGRGVDWFSNARLLVHADWLDRLEQAGEYDDRVGPKPEQKLPPGDGSHGMLEGFNSTIRYDGSQATRWWIRADCNAEASMAHAFHFALTGNTRSRDVAANLNDFIYFDSNLQQGPRANPDSPSFGLVGWNTVEDHRYVEAYWGDDNARVILGSIAAAAILNDDRWDEPLLKCLLGNLRTTGVDGYRGRVIHDTQNAEGRSLQDRGWEYFWNDTIRHYAPHFEAWPWACFLWAYHKTGFEPFLERSKRGFKTMMAAYPHDWHWTNGIQQERARMLFALAWLVRVEDTPEHRAWLEQIGDDLLAHQAPCGAFQEEVGSVGKGRYGPPATNEAYGTTEAPLIQRNGDPVADLLYTTNFGFAALHEAAAATGNDRYHQAADRLADFLLRIQVRSDSHPELDGAWFRAIDFGRWEYWASNADSGWGAWCTETGWTQSWIVAVLAMRQMKTSLWDLTAGSRIGRHLPDLLPMMLPQCTNER